MALAHEEAGAGTPVVCLHGLTATRRHVLMGSRHLERSGHRVVLYDARGHGASPPAPTPGAYGYADLAGDLERLLDQTGIDRAVLAGVSMGAHTAVRFALDRPDRVAALALITPAYRPENFPSGLDGWDALARGLRDGGVDGFLAAYDTGRVDPAWRDVLETAIRQRLAAHEHPDAVADALAAVPRSRPFAALEDLAAIEVPTLVVGSRDAADPGHPLATARVYAEAIPGARLEVEEAGRAPLAWQGGQLSRLIANLAA
ncbi:MAG: alpha/beta fold hydrolase [Solirubrobacteraceae bacterium]